MTSHDILIHLVSTLDRTSLGCIDDCPPGTAWIDFVAPPDVVHYEGGKFFPEHDQIDVYRQGAPPDPRGSPVDAARASVRPTHELISLAHELGHLHSKLCGNPSPPENVPDKVYLEEVRAWRFARRLLMDNGFTEWQLFDDECTCGLRSYRDGLGLSELQTREATHIVDEEFQVR